MERDVKKLHPCFGSLPNTGRIHLPVCQRCNIQCNFCDRKINDYEKRPGVTASILEPGEAIAILEEALKICPKITVAGIAGPGDTLASDHAVETFKLIKNTHPHLLRCMSTNGLLLNERAQELIDVGIDSLTVTVNAVAPEILEKIVSGIVYHGTYIRGTKAAELLIFNQLEGIKKMAAAGTAIKVNTVLINEINKEHIKEVARTVKAAGASMYNIIPLIPQYKFRHLKEPGCGDIDGARREAGEYIDVFRHCQRCRADAVGIPGVLDVAGQLYKGKIKIRETFSHG
jgi:nitrogen fixation protein NifB